ncbi:MAG: DUF4430 domain-containing protein [Peptococcaceae bacterium]|nr:DUF4430 domain-containing protein [Peptococcaceae bacterium]
MRKRGTKKFWLLSLVILLLCLWTSVSLAADGMMAGEGTIDSPYLIADSADLKAFRDMVNSGARTLCGKLTADIDLNGEEWIPIGGNDGYATSYYSGCFDGDGHAITNLQIHADYNFAGFFSYVKDGAVISRLQIKEAVITSGKNNVGGIVGTIIDGTIENCSFDGAVTNTKASGGYAGGIAGYMGSTKTTKPIITGCVNFGDIRAPYAGGVTGYAKFAEIMDCCNHGVISGDTRVGGVAGQTMNGTAVKNCYNDGEIKGASAAGIIGFNGSSMENCYWMRPEAGMGGGTGAAMSCEKVTDTTGLAEKLGAAFITDKNGSVLLTWQTAGTPEPVKPSITILSSQGNTLWVEKGGSNKNDTTLKVTYKGMGDETPVVTWSIDNGEIVKGQLAENKQDYILMAKKGGVATITATVEYGGETYTADYQVTVIPHFTTAEIKNIAVDYPSNIAVGQTITAVLNTTDGIFDPVDYAGPHLTYQWYSYELLSNQATLLTDATDVAYTIAEDFPVGGKIGVSIYCNGQEVHSYQDGQKTVQSIDYGKLYPVAYLIDLPTDIREDIQLALPSFMTKDGITAQIEWSGFDETIAADGSVTRPQTGKREVTLTGKFTYQGAYLNRYFKMTVWSDEAAEADANDKQNILKEAIASLGSAYTIYPVYGKDTNVTDILTEALVAKGYDDIAVSVKAVQEVYGGAGIANDGKITYFYADPNHLPAIKHGSYRVTFTLEKDGVTLDDTDVPVIIYWDRDLVKAVMTSEILDKVVLDEKNPLRGNLSLPKVIDEKRWVQISWQSSDDRVLSISSANQTTADTLFAPYIGVVKPGQEQQVVTLTAAFTFQLTNDIIGREEPMVLYKTFDINVAPLDGEQVAVIQKELLAKLDQGFAAKGLRDGVTGKQLLAEENGIYQVANDILLPTTRDFGVDGKYYPITITSANEAVAKTPDVANAARVAIYRPGVGEADETVVITVTIQDRDTSVTASRSFTVSAAALTGQEVEKELALMDQVKAAYFDGLKGNNAARDDVRTDLTPFQEVYADASGNLVWVRNHADRVGYGIVPTPIQGWEDLELWRLFKSSNPNVISHETLEVTRQPEAKGVTVTSYLSSETLGRYGELYQKDPVRYGEYADLAELYYQEVSTDVLPPAARAGKKASLRTLVNEEIDTLAMLNGVKPMVVRGTKNPDSTVPVVETIQVSFSLCGLDGETWIADTNLENLDEAATVYDVFTRMLSDNGYTATRQKGTYIVSISGNKGSLTEKEYGDRSGWMYRVNGKIPDVYMGAHPLHDGDVIQVFYTRDAKKDDPNWTWSMGSGSISSNGGAADNKGDAVLVEKDQANDGYIITLPQDSQTVQKVVLPQGKTGQLVVKIAADGSQEVIKKAVVSDGKARFFLRDDALIKLVDYQHGFQDVTDAAWYAEAVNFVSGRKIFSGVEDNRFAPEDTLSRGMFVTALYRLEEPEIQTLDLPFADVPAGAWYEKAAVWAHLVGIAGGDGDGTFRPDDAVTREDLAVMLYRYGRMLNLSTSGRDSLTSFTDSGDVSHWARDAVAWAVDSDILHGDDGLLMPKETATRAEAAIMLERFVIFMMK